ncbi:hypothetical protein SLEP1_g49905 [Rubroshorea leprosula]|uniref:Uncharacterized protein n=1 Tax=Rubroshorea leprosula TaxID=152421 RepID=A0AAV5LZ37_9ROSI|nr:hypothetical protein SLEP1_g49905 [Rubroshorea leprosula]
MLSEKLMESKECNEERQLKSLSWPFNAAVSNPQT